MQVVEDRTQVAIEPAHGLSDVADFLGFDDADREATQAADVLRAMSGLDATAVLVKVPVEDIVAAIFDDPMTAVDLQQALGVGLIAGAAGDAVGEFPRAFAALLVDSLAFDHVGLADMGKLQIAIQRGGGPNSSRLDSALFAGRGFDEIRGLPSAEVKRDVLLELGLVAFDGEVVVGPTPTLDNNSEMIQGLGERGVLLWLVDDLTSRKSHQSKSEEQK